MRMTSKYTTGVILPTFEEYPNRLAPKQLVYYTPSNRDFSYTALDIISFFDNKPIEQLLIINPDNPSGNLLSKMRYLR